MKKIERMWWLLLVYALLIQACGDNKKAKNYNEKTLVDDRGLQFILAANEAGLTEIKAANIAEEKSNNQRVIAFAKMMANDHSVAGQDLNNLAQSQLVTKVDTISKAHQQSLDSLAQLSGVAFDKAYIHMMVKDHAKVVQLFEDESTNKNSHVQSFARKMLPTLKMHLDSANAISTFLK